MTASWTNTRGIVSLVGAGPGDPALITVRGMRLLEQADVVIYDYLASPRLLSYCPQAEQIYVGKKAAAHAFTQDQINALLVEKGKTGKRVVRLKGGDPFIFGRGGEECLALANAGIPFEVVPGITAAIGAPAYAGIPVTHRDFNSSFTFITGHEKEEEYKDPQAKGRDTATGSSDLDWSVIAKLPCIAFYMGVKSLPRICSKLIESGMSSDTPAAVIRWGTRPDQQTVVGTLASLAKRAEDAGIKPPALTIIGKVVSLRDSINWFESRPLFGQTVVVTRTRQQSSGLTDQLAALGADVIEAPTIDLAPAANPAETIDPALRRAADFDWVVFTSANGVHQTRRRLFDLGLDVRALGQAKIAAIGDATAAACRDALGIQPDLTPSRAVAEALADEFASRNQIAGKKFLLLRADIARPILRQQLEQGGAAQVLDRPIYETKIADTLPPAFLEALDARRINWITFSSSSTAKNLATLLGPDYREKLQGIYLASIGPITTQTLKDLGLAPTVQSEESNIEGLVNAIVLRAPRPC